MAEKLGVQIRRYDIIYQVTDDLKAALEGMLRPERGENATWAALWCSNLSTSAAWARWPAAAYWPARSRDARVRIIRESRVIGDYAIDSLKREKDDAREVRDGLECGIKLAGFNDVKEGDVLEAYKIEEIARTF